jgi:hypothetical protein
VKVPLPVSGALLPLAVDPATPIDPFNIWSLKLRTKSQATVLVPKLTGRFSPISVGTGNCGAGWRFDTKLNCPL